MSNKLMLISGVFTFSVIRCLPRGSCSASPALLLWDPPCATYSWDPGSPINEQIETDSNPGADTINKCPCTVLAVLYFFLYFSDALCYFASDASTFDVLLQSGWLWWEKHRMSNNMAKIADARKTVEQLKLEVNIERMMVSHQITDLNNR